MKKESKAKSVIIAVIAIILALCAVGAVVGIGSNGFENLDPSTWFKPQEEPEEPEEPKEPQPEVVTYDDITTVINGLSLDMTDERVHASRQTVANSNGGTDTWYYYTFSLDDKGLYTGSTEYNHDYYLFAYINNNWGYSFNSLSSENAKAVLDYNSAIWGEKCIFHNSYVYSDEAYHFYVYPCRIDDVSAYLNGDTSVCHAKDNVLTIGISIKDEEIGSFVVNEFSRLCNDFDALATVLEGVNTADYVAIREEGVIGDEFENGTNDYYYFWNSLVSIPNIRYTGTYLEDCNYTMTINVDGTLYSSNDCTVITKQPNNSATGFLADEVVSFLFNDDLLCYVTIIPYEVTSFDDVDGDFTYVSLYCWLAENVFDFTIVDISYNA